MTQIWSPQKGLPTLSAMRMQHYAVFLESFNFEIRYRNSKDHGNADGISRLPLKGEPICEADEIDVLQINQTESLPVQAKEVAKYTLKDTTVQELVRALRTGRIVEG